MQPHTQLPHVLVVQFCSLSLQTAKVIFVNTKYESSHVVCKYFDLRKELVQMLVNPASGPYLSFIQ